MRLYNIDNQIELALSRCIDSETGEIIDEDYFQAVEDLKLNREEMLLDIACLVKDYEAEAEKFDKEIENLKARKQRFLNLAETQERLIKRYIQDGEKLEDARVKIIWRKSSSIMIDRDVLELPDRFIRTKIEADRRELEAAIRSGEKIEGVYIKPKLNMSIK